MMSFCMTKLEFSQESYMLLGGFLTFCHPYRSHSLVCHFYTCSYIIVIANSEPPTFLPCLLTWHARWEHQRGSEPEKAYRACEMTYLLLLLLSLYSLTRGPHTSALSSTSSHHPKPSDPTASGLWRRREEERRAGT